MNRRRWILRLVEVTTPYLAQTIIALALLVATIATVVVNPYALAPAIVGACLWCLKMQVRARR